MMILADQAGAGPVPALRRAGIRPRIQIGRMRMLQVFGFDRIGVVVGDIYFLDPAPANGQEGAEHGVRVEVRMLEPGELSGSIYASRPIRVAEPVWRVDLLESVDSAPGSLNRAHHHPHMRDWEPGKRVFDRE